MSRMEVDDLGSDESHSAGNVFRRGVFSRFHDRGREQLHVPKHDAEFITERRRTPRRSLIVILPDDHVVSPEAVARRLVFDSGLRETDVIVACAGQPTNLGALQQRVPDLQLLLAPSGTSTEDLRELAMRKAPGDIVTLLTGCPTGERGDPGVQILS